MMQPRLENCMHNVRKYGCKWKHIYYKVLGKSVLEKWIPPANQRLSWFCFSEIPDYMQVFAALQLCISLAPNQFDVDKINKNALIKECYKQILLAMHLRWSS